MKMVNAFLQSVLLCAVVAISVHGQLQTGFISIDCGAPVNFNYVDMDTGISYTSDGAFIDTGVNRNISSEYAYPKNPNLAQPLSDLRIFPEGVKNCYTLKPAGGNGSGSLHLIRASFLYGNYDGQDNPPQFDLHLDANFWSSVKFRNSSDVFTTEIIGSASSENIYVCLMNTGLGVPFISGLELRPLNNSIYGSEYGTSASLLLFQRLNIGAKNGSGRYTDDIYDRIWSFHDNPSWIAINTSSAVDTTGDGFRAPSAIIQTAARPRTDNQSLEVSWTSADPGDEFCVFMYFAEVEQLQINQSREFNISWNGLQLHGPFSPRYLYATALSNSKVLVGDRHQILIHKTVDSVLPPILNAIEIYNVKKLNERLTHIGDADAITSVKSTYGIVKNWAGDPCGPRNYSWEGLVCNYSSSEPARVISLHLSSSGLNGAITVAFGKLSLLESLDLSNNSLTGPVPNFLEELQNLKFLSLRGNHLSGIVPSALLERSKAGLLTLSVDDQNLCNSASCKKKKNILIPILIPLLSVLLLLVALIVIWKLRRKRKSELASSNNGGRYIASKKRHFTYDEVVSITNNFQNVIGKGGFGSVFLGTMRDGMQVAVKMLSPSSSQGPQEFQTEAELLMRVHHRNLASFVGYCEEGNNMALIYEYMANGNLKNYLSDCTHYLSWELRLRIAIDAAQGLEYLHHGCKPPIIHRDVKTANILLSENMDAKIADFGLSKAVPSESHSHVMTSVMGTTGYLDPEYYITQKLNEKSDVYSFGIVLLELITGQPAIIKDGERIHILQWIHPFLERQDIEGLVDPRLQGDFDNNSICKALEVAIACTPSTSIQRPTMSFVLSELKHCLDMEVSSERERSSRPRPDIATRMSSSTEIYSMDLDSMSYPSAR